MDDHIPFVSSKADSHLAGQDYSNARALRLELNYVIKNGVSRSGENWIDPAIDGLHSWSDRSPAWINYVSQFCNYDFMRDKHFQASPEKAVVEGFTFSVLDMCNRYNPNWITVPQLPPSVESASRNRINRMLADATGTWRAKTNFEGNLILPLIFTHQNQINYKAERTKRISATLRCFERATADGVWAVDSTLTDTDGSPTFQKRRFPELINFHVELKQALPTKAIVIAGPYWAMNLILWARGLVDYPAVGIGSGYQYYISGGLKKFPTARVVLPPLRRRAIASADLQAWLSDSLSKLSSEDDAFVQFRALLQGFLHFQDASTAKRQAARFYKVWFDRIAASPKSGRALALYQDLSSAYVLGKTLGPLPKGEKTARRPERPAEQFMLMCL